LTPLVREKNPRDVTKNATELSKENAAIM
jgi:hypothetical protein